MAGRPGWVYTQGMDARDFGIANDPDSEAREAAASVRGVPPVERFRRFLDLVAFGEGVWRSLSPEARARALKAERADDPGLWWERVPRR